MEEMINVNYCLPKANSDSKIESIAQIKTHNINCLI